MRIHAEKKCAHRESSPAHEEWICALREEEDDEETFTLKSDESSRRLSRSHSELSFFPPPYNANGTDFSHSHTYG